MATVMRRDIQLLRGVAVLLVVFFHADIGFFNNGYLGVDVFFVISGFLITSIILKELDKNRFSFSTFYLRRAKRLLPALYCTLVVTALLAYGFITVSEQRDFVAQLVGALTFSSNMVLPTQLGYFEDAAGGKLLLHVWSLSLEEQYYFFLPLLLFLIPKQGRIYALVALTLISFAWCLSWVSSSGTLPPLLWRFSGADVSEWAFYLFPTRAWELLAGSICAWIMLYKIIKIPSIVKWMALLAIFLMSCVSLDGIHPRGDAFIVVLATASILLGSGDWLPKWGVVRQVERVGDWSYSVYLVHWPLFACAYLGYVGSVPVVVKLSLIPISILLGFVQYHFIETPFRHGWKQKTSRTWFQFVSATLAVVMIPVPMAIAAFENAQGSPDKFTEIRRTNYGLSDKCDHWISSGISSECITGEKPEIAIWGDSFAMHLVPGLVEKNHNLIQLTKSTCAPIMDLAPIYGRYMSDWAEMCVKFNETSLEKILSTDSIHFVILGSTFIQYFDSNFEGKFFVDGEVVPKVPAQAIAAFIQTIEKLQAAGKVPILFSPPPRSGFNIGECLERKESGLALFRKECDVLVSDYFEYEKDIRKALKYIGEKTAIKIVWLNEMLCNQEKCKSKINSTFVYKDKHHLSISGSKALLGKLVIQDI